MERDMKPTEFTWDLSDLFASANDPKIAESLDAVQTKAKAFEKKYRNKINTPTLKTETLLCAMKELEEIVSELEKSGAYAYMLFSADTSKPENGALMQFVQQRSSEISLDLIFFDLELMEVPDNTIDPILADERFQNYAHFAKAARLFKDHRLPEGEEKIMELKANTGARAFQRLFDETVSAINFDLTVDGKKQKLTEPELLAYQRSDDRKLRIASARSLSKGLMANGKTLTFIFNTLAWDKQTDDGLRKYEYPQQSRHLANELEAKTVDMVMDSCVNHYTSVSRYYNIKREILGVPKLYHYDRYAPLFESKEELSFEDAQNIVLNAYGEFSPLMRKCGEKFFKYHWIDAQPRKGKQGGAYCMTMTPEVHPYILMSYLNRKDDIMTLAHELGHGVHGTLSCANQTTLNVNTPLPIAELASTFGEMLVFESLVKNSSIDEKLALYASKIEDIFATVFRQAAMYRFESEFHAARREKGELRTEDINDIWQKNIQEMFGKSVKMGDEHKCWWMYVSHFIGSPFYVYAYSFGELLVMSLISMYKREGKPFVKKFEQLLSTGGSCSPEDLLSRVGINIRDKNFWEGGMAYLNSMIDEFEKIYREWKQK